MVKLNKSKIKWLINQVVKYKRSPSEVASIYGLSVRRVQQLVKQYRDTKKYPELIGSRRPKNFLSETQKNAILEAYNDTRLSARLLYYELKSRGCQVPKNKLYKFMLEQGLVKENPHKKKQRKRCRYERKHTGSLVHTDYHRKNINSKHCILWVDDASRFILSGGEFDKATEKHAEETFLQAQQKMQEVNWRIQQVNTDRGSQFYGNKIGKKSKGISQFEKFLKQHNVKHIVSRANNPQTNGKIERRWLEYDRHRHRFNTLQEWINWMNNRLTTALDIKNYETPKKAFYRKLPNILALFLKQKENDSNE